MDQGQKSRPLDAPRVRAFGCCQHGCQIARSPQVRKIEIPDCRNSRTIASWEYAWQQDKERLTCEDILVVDEAGMIGSRQLGRLTEQVHAAGAQLVLVAGAEQLHAIEAGAAFRAIADRVGVIAITEPRRQFADWQRMATKELESERNAAAGRHARRRRRRVRR